MAVLEGTWAPPFKTTGAEATPVRLRLLVLYNTGSIHPNIYAKHGCEYAKTNYVDTATQEHFAQGH